MTGDALARSALALTGCRFRLHGRDPQCGLDCIGVVVAALKASGHRVTVPTGYRLRTAQPDALLGGPAQFGLVDAAGSAISPGDILVSAPGLAQLHFSIAVAGPAHVHAHAALRKVVLTPGMPSGHLLHRWRLPEQGN